jgi:hypothetical protein
MPPDRNPSHCATCTPAAPTINKNPTPAAAIPPSLTGARPPPNAIRFPPNIIKPNPTDPSVSFVSWRTPKLSAHPWKGLALRSA